MTLEEIKNQILLNVNMRAVGQLVGELAAAKMELAAALAEKAAIEAKIAALSGGK